MTDLQREILKLEISELYRRLAIAPIKKHIATFITLKEAKLKSCKH